MHLDASRAGRIINGGENRIFPCEEERGMRTSEWACLEEGVAA